MSGFFRFSSTYNIYHSAWLYYNFSHEKSERLFSLLVENTCSDLEFQSFLLNLFTVFPKTDDYLDSRWLVATAALQYQELKDDLSNEFALKDFQNLKNEFTKAIQQSLSLEEIPEPMVQPTCFNFLVFRDMNPGLFYILLPHFAPVINKIGVERMFKVFGPETLSFIVEPDIEFFKKLEVDPKMIVLFFKYPITYLNLDFTYLLQSKFAMKTSQCQMVDFAIVNNKHCFEKFDMFFKSFLKQDDLKMGPYITLFKEAVPLFLVKNYDTILANPQKFMPLLSKDYGNSVANETIQRMKNDSNLIQMISFLTSNEMTYEEFIKHSITYHCQFSLGKPTILDYANQNYFLVPDSEKQIEFDVIRGYILLRSFLIAFKSYSKQLKSTCLSIRNYLLVMNPKVREIVCLDLFSLIFVKQKNKYVCHPCTAQKIIKVILEFLPGNQYILGAQAIFEGKKPKKTDTTSIETYLDRDLNSIFKMVETKKWESAEERTRFLPYYRSFYKKAHISHLISHSLPIPPELEDEKESGMLNVTCSILNHGFIKEAIKRYPEYEKFLNLRLKVPKEESVMNCIETRVQWGAAMSSVAEIEESPLELIGSKMITSHLKNFAVSKNLLKFISDTYLYFESASLYAGDGTLETVFHFDMRKALAGPFNVGDKKKTEQLAQIFNVDLFPFIMNNLSWFVITEDFVTKYFEQFPIEVMALSVRHGFNELLNQNEKVSGQLKKFIDQPPLPPPTRNAQKKTGILGFIKNGDIEKIEDAIYKVDHNLLYKKLITLDVKNFTDAQMYALNITDYVAPEEDELTLKKIRIYYTVGKITKSSEVNQIVTDIYNADKFDLSIDYIKYCITTDLWGQPICTLFQLSIGNGDQMSFILREFQDRFDLLSSRFFHVEGVVQYLIKECPKSKLDLIRGISLLPETITQDSNIFDTDTVVAAFARHTECIFMINKEIDSLFTDNDYFSLLDQIEHDTYIYNKVLPFLYQFFRDKKSLRDRWIDKICNNIILPVKVDSIESEQRHKANFHRLVDPQIQLFQGNDDKIQWIKCTNAFINFEPFIRYHISYDFSELVNDKLRFADICADIDKLEISRSLNINIFSTIIRQVKIMLALGQEKPIKILFSKYKSLFIDNYDTGRVYYDDSYIPFLCFTKMPIFDTNTINQLAKMVPVKDATPLPPLFIFQQIKVTRRLEAKRKSERDPFYDYMLKNAITLPNTLAIYVTYKDYESAFDYLDRKIGDERNDLFVHKFFLPAICNNTINSLEKYILREKGDEYSDFIWTNTLRFFESRQCRHTMFNINRRLGHFEAAADACFRLFDEENSLLHQIELLGHAIWCLTEALNGGPTEEPAELLEDRKTKTMFQLKLCQFFNDKGTPNKKEYNLMRGETAALALGALFLINGERGLLNELAELIPIDPKAVSTRASDTLLEMPIDKILGCLNMMKANNLRIVDYVQEALLRKLQAKGNRQLILNLILTCWNEPMKQCLLMIEYDYISEAMLLAAREKFGDLIPTIGKRASELGIADVIQRGEKILTKIARPVEE